MIAVFESARGNHRRPRLVQRPLIPCTIKDSSEPRIVMVETVEVVFDIPLYAYNLLDTDMGVELTLGCCTVVNERDVESRVKSWKRPGTVGLNTRTPALKTLCKQMLGLGLEQPVRVRFEKKHWPFIVMLTERLGITVAEWLLGGVGYAVWLKERTVQTLGMEGRVSK